MSAAEARPLRVLVVTPKGDLGGAERWLLAVGDATNRLHLSVAVLEEGPVIDRLVERGWPVWSRPTGRSLRGLWESYRWLGAVIAETTPDVILLNGVKPGLLVGPWAKRRRIPMVLVKHGTAFERSLAPFVARASAACIAVSQAHAATLPSVKTRVIPPARPSVVKRRLREPASGPLVLLMATRLVPNKGVDTAIAALAIAREWRLVVAGADDGTAPGERARLLALAMSRGVGPRVHFLGEVPSIDGLFDEVDAVAVLSRADKHHPTPAEGFGMVVIEAASAGIPVIADPAEVPSVAALGGAGVVAVVAADPRAVARGLELLSDRDVRFRVSEAGYEAASRHPSAEDVADQVADVLASCVADG